MSCNFTEAQPGGVAMPSIDEISEILARYTTAQIDGDDILKYLRHLLEYSRLKLSERMIKREIDAENLTRQLYLRDILEIRALEKAAETLQTIKDLHLTVSPSGNRWEVAYCNWSQSGTINAVGTTNGKEWSRENTLDDAVQAAKEEMEHERRNYAARRTAD